jgi:Periplasmic binding protein-like domain
MILAKPALAGWCRAVALPPLLSWPTDVDRPHAIEVLRASGCRIPEDVAVVDFDDIPLGQEMIPPLTTVRIPLTEIGRRAAARLLRPAWVKNRRQMSAQVRWSNAWHSFGLPHR